MARETDDDIRPLALGGKVSYVAAAKLAAKVLAVIVPAILSAVGAYRSAATDTQERVQASKNKSEAGYQVTRQAVEALERRVLALEEANRKLEQLAAPRPRGKVASHRGTAAPPAPAAGAVQLKQLPSNLDQAERQVYRAVSAQSVPQEPRPPVDTGPP